MNLDLGGAKKILGVVLAVLLLVALGIFSVKFLGKGSPKEVRKLPAAITLKLFQGKNPPFDFTFEYPAAWKVKEREFKDQFDMVQITGPQDRVTRVIPGIFVKVQKEKDAVTLESLAESFPKKEQQFKEFKQLSNNEVVIGGISGKRLEYQYILQLPLQAKIAKDTLLKRGEIFIPRKHKMYQISTWMTEAQYKMYKPVLDHALETFTFLD
jgi:hypothetical protein